MILENRAQASNTFGGKIFLSSPGRSWGPSSLLSMDTRTLSGVKRSGRGD